MYDNQPDGLAGNEDCGQMSAWYVMSAVGFYAVDPISGNYVFDTPLFEKVSIDLGNGKHFVLETQRSSPSDKYIESIAFNGAGYDRTWFRHEDLVAGGHFLLRMSKKPNPTLGSPSISRRLPCHRRNFLARISKFVSAGRLPANAGLRLNETFLHHNLFVAAKGKIA